MSLTKRELEITERWHATMERQAALVRRPVADFTGQARALAKSRPAPRVPRKHVVCGNTLLIGCAFMLRIVGELLQDLYGELCASLSHAAPICRYVLANLLAWPLCGLAQAVALGISLERPTPAPKPVAVQPPVHATSWQAQRALCERRVRAADEALMSLERFENRTLLTCIGLYVCLGGVVAIIGS